MLPPPTVFELEAVVAIDTIAFCLSRFDGAEGELPVVAITNFSIPTVSPTFKTRPSLLVV